MSESIVGLEAMNDPSQKTVRDIMQTKVVTISAGDTLSTVEDIMTLGGVRHMPVVHRGVLVGVVSERDLLRASLSNLTEFGMEERRAFLQVVEITRVMSTPPIVISPDVTVPQAARILVEHRIGCLPVLEDGKLIGLVTEADVLRYLAGPLTGRY
jgi:CBS domain-containing protein